MTLQVLTEAAVDRLRHRVDGLVLTEYSSGQIQLNAADLRRTVIEPRGAAPLLEPGSGRQGLAGREVKNAVAVYEWLDALTPRQAADPRLWTTLCHVEFAGYCASRWKVTARSIKSHWFVDGVGLAGLRRNAIARLWWAVKLSRRPGPDHPSLGFLASRAEWSMLEALFANQDIYQGLMERSFGSDEIVRYSVLSVLDDARRAGQELTSDLVTKALKAVNLTCSYREVGVTDPQVLRGQLSAAIEAL